MSNTLLILAILPVVLLCLYIYKKDSHKEPLSLLLTIFFLGFVMAIPVLLVEGILGIYFATANVTNFTKLFVNVFISIALVEEGAKWIVTKFAGYDNKEFDEIYDIIVYSVFASLGFACIENILYVFSNGLMVAIMRALLSIPGHMCFGVLMGYFFAKAKISQINNSRLLLTKNMILSILIPSFAHAMYDALIFYSTSIDDGKYFLIFLVYDVLLVILCFKTVKSVSKIQRCVRQNVDNGVISNHGGEVVVSTNNISSPNYCPVCGSNVLGSNFCGQCGYRIK